MREHEVHGELHGLARPDPSDMVDRARERGEDRTSALDVFPLAPSHDDERSVLGGLAAPENRSVGEARAARRGELGGPARGRDAVRSHVDEKGLLAEGACDARRTLQDLDERLGASDHHDDDVGCRRGLSRRRDEAGPARGEGRRPRWGPVEDAEREPCSEKVRGHRRSHRAEADPGDFGFHERLSS